MEVPIQVAVRLFPPEDKNSLQWLNTDPESHSVICSNGQIFKVDNALPVAVSQNQLYSSIIPVQINSILNGCDTSVVTLGQSKTGKTYTLLGPCINAIMDDEECGLIPRFIKDIFARVGETPERSYVIHITWMRLINETIVDLLGCGLAKCSNLSEALRLLHKGAMHDKWTDIGHTVFTVTIEQKWIGIGDILQHKLSTASFCELAAYPEPSLLSLEDVIKCLLQPCNNKVDYQQSLLTAMLRDSFGGRAFTWIICCLSSDMKYAEESQRYLELSWCCRGIKNVVTVNGYADNNTAVLNVNKSLNKPPDEIFGLQFAAQQWVKLVVNAEGLFQKLLESNSLSEIEIAEINEWLFLKAECDECLNANTDMIHTNNDIDGDLITQKQTLPRISEDTEPSELSDTHSESDTSFEHDQFLFNDKLYKYIEYFEEKTDELVLDRCEEYLRRDETKEPRESYDPRGSLTFTDGVRRKTIRPGETLSEDELDLLRRTAAKAISPESQKIILESQKSRKNPESLLVQRELLKIIDSPVPSESNKKYKSFLQKYNLKENLVSKLSKEIEGAEAQLKELTSLCLAKEQLIDDLSKIIKRQGNVKRWSDMKHASIKQENGKTKADMIVAQSKYIVGNGDSKDVKKHEMKLKMYKKQIEQLKKHIKRDEKRKNTLELELIKDKSKLDEMYDMISKGVEFKHKDKKEMNILNEKSYNSSKCESSEDNESMLRSEIRNLRKTKECLVDKRCSLGHKRKIHKSLSDSEERKLLECEEAIEAIDTAIEYKNALICGRGQDKDVIGGGQQRERGEEMLMARLSKLSDVEMRTLLYKYFQKVIDLRSTCVSLEAASVACQREAASWRRRCADAWTTLHHTRIMHHRRTTTLTARHYHTLNQLMREMSGDTDTDIEGLYNGVYSPSNNEGGTLPSLEYHQHNAHSMPESDSEKGFTTQHRIAATTAKIKLKDNCARPNTTFLNEIQHIAQYHQTQNFKQIGASSAIPSQNLKHLQSSSCSPLTKVTRQKNKLVIVQEEKSLV